MQKPTIGRIVIVPVSAETPDANGADQAAAIVTRVFESPSSPTGYLVNVRVLLDGRGEPQWRTSVELHDEQPEHYAGRHIAWWPPRV